MHEGRIVIRPRRRADPVMPRQPPRRARQQDLLGRAIQRHHHAALGPDLGHQRIGAQLPAQPQRDLPDLAADQRRLCKLKHLPLVRTAIADRHRIRAIEHLKRRRRFQRPAGQLHPQGRAAVPDPGRRPKQRRQRLPDHRPRAKRRIQRIARIRVRGPDRHRPRPRRSRHRQMRRHRVLVPRHQRQIQKDRAHRHRRRKGAQAGRVLDLVGGGIDPGLHPHRLDLDQPRLLDPVDPVTPPPLGQIQPHHIARAQMRLRGRQRKPRRVPRHPCLGQPAPHDPLRLRPRQRQRQFRPRRRARHRIGKNRLDRAHLEIALRLDIGQPHPPGDLGLGRPHRLDDRLALAQRQIRRSQIGIHPPVAHPEHQLALAFQRLEPIGQHQRLQPRPPGLIARHRVAAHQPIKPAHVDLADPGGTTDLGHDARQRLRHRAPRNPVPARVILAIRPQGGIERKLRPGPGIPGPDMRAAHVQHRPAINRRDRVLRRLSPIARHRAQILHLDQLVAPPVGMMRQARFRTFRVEKLVGLVRALVDRRTAHLGEPDRFRLRHPSRRFLGSHTAHPLVMRIQPPVADVLGPPDPGLVMRAIADRRADLRRTMFGRGIIPVIILAALDIGAQIVERVDRPPMRIHMILALPPIRQRQVIVDADEVDVRIRP